MQTISINDVEAGCQNISKGARVAFANKEGKIKIGTVKIRKVNCGKEGCKKCPHASYAYAQYRDGKKVKEKYIGKVW